MSFVLLSEIAEDILAIKKKETGAQDMDEPKREMTLKDLKERYEGTTNADPKALLDRMTRMGIGNPNAAEPVRLVDVNEAQ